MRVNKPWPPPATPTPKAPDERQDPCDSDTGNRMFRRAGSLYLRHRGCSTLSGLMLQPVSLSRGFHPGLFCSTPPGWFPDQSHGSLAVTMRVNRGRRRRLRFRSRYRRLQMNGRIPVIQILVTACPACGQSVSAAQRLFNPFRVDASACLSILEGRFSPGSVSESASGSQSDPVSMQTDPIPGTVGDHHFEFRYRRRPRFRSRPRRLSMSGRA